MKKTFIRFICCAMLIMTLLSSCLLSFATSTSTVTENSASTGEDNVISWGDLIAGKNTTAVTEAATQADNAEKGSNSTLTVVIITVVAVAVVGTVAVVIVNKKKK